MKNISEINIQKLFPAVIYRRGMDYYKQNKVSDLLYDINYQVWTATVHGSEDYFVEINMKDFGKGSIDTYCDCPAFDTFGSCKHIAATLISIVNKEADISNVPVKPNYQLTNSFIQAISQVPLQNKTTEILTDKIPMHVEYYCNWTFDKNLKLEIRTGEKHCYVVKDAFEFLRDVLQGRDHYFTKKFAYNPDTHYFLQKDYEIFETLFSIKRNEEIYQSSYYMEGSGGDKRYLTIPPLAAKMLLEKLSERDFTVEAKGKSFRNVAIEKDKLPFNFSVTKNDQNDLMLKMGDADGATYFQLYEMMFHQGIFYYPAKEQVQILEEISRFGMNDLELPIQKAQADTFLSEVMPSLKKIGNVEVSETITEEIVQLPLRAKLYLEVKADWITGKLEYHYGDQLINPFTGRKENDDVIIIRDVEKEQQIMQLIEHANFHYNGKDLYIEAEEDELYDFLYYVLPLLDDYVELFLTQEIRGMIVENSPLPSTSVRLESSSNLLEIGFDINGVNDSEINEILNAVIEKKRYYRLGSGELLSLEGEEFSSMKRFFEDMDIQKDDLQGGNVHMPVYRGAQLDELIDTKKNYDPSFRHLLNQLKSPEDQVYELPESLTASLRNYQLTGFQWFKSLSNYHLGGILADDMGLGKTLQAIAYLASESEGETSGPHLIVAPSSVVYNWKNEFEKFSPNLTAVVLTGIPDERHELIENSADTDVWITSYATLRQDIEIYREMIFQTMILDEAQYIKNYATKTSRAIREITATRRFALSGTPIENSIDELWAIFQVVLPGLMPNHRSFKQLSNEKIAMITRPFILRRLKKDVLKELPDKIESVHVSELTKEQKDLYVGYLRQVQQEATQSIQDSGFNQNRMKILAGLTRLRQICCHPALFIENYEGYSGKLEQLMDTIKTAMENGKRMLIFSQFTSMHEIIKGRLEKEGYGYFYLHGQTPSKDRVEMSERFNNGENNIFLISLKAGGTGLNLTGADTVILYDLWWNPAVEDQATGRAHRFGQKNVVQVIRLVTEGTIEEKIYDLQQKKRELIDQVIQPGETMLSSLSEDDVKELLSL
ncbi:SNF2 helicase associated domain-containing protein [Oceanobacillus longus]|uniref:SNF2 helicase associated domain-containing protein n=1 Tax=Oceanobacillus longus TaxID=930120 RepID=A0ABV8GU94_9BACI